MKKPFTNRILGVNIAITNMQETVNLMIEHLEEIRGQFICLSNVHTTVMSERMQNIERYRILHFWRYRMEVRWHWFKGLGDIGVQNRWPGRI